MFYIPERHLSLLPSNQISLCLSLREIVVCDESGLPYTNPRTISPVKFQQNQQWQVNTNFPLALP